MKRDIKKLPKWAQSHFKHLAEMKEFAVEQYNVVLELNKKAVSEIKKYYAEIAYKEALIVELSEGKRIYKDYCPKCDSEQEYVSNPFYLHICTECKNHYNQSDLIRK